MQYLREISSDPIIDALKEGNIELEDFKQTFLIKKEVIERYQAVLNMVKGDVNGGVRISSRDLLTIYLFAFFDFAQDLKEVSIRLVDILHKGDVATMPSAIESFQDAYMTWKEENRMEVIRELTNLFWEYELIHHLNSAHYTEAERDIYVSEKTTKQNALMSELGRLGGLEYFYSYQPVVMDEAFVEIVKEQLKRAFWQKMKEDLPDITGVLDVLGEVRKKLDVVAPAMERETLLTLYDEMIDIEYIKQLHGLGATDATFWKNKCQFLKEMLDKLDSSDRKLLLEDMWKEIVAGFDGTFGVLIDFLAYVTERMEDLMNMKMAVFARA